MNLQPTFSVLVVSQYSSRRVGGAERYIHETTCRLARRGLQVAFVAADRPEKSGLAVGLPLFSGSYHPLWPRQMDRILHQFRPDVIYGHFTVPGITDVALRRAGKLGIPVCLVYHSDVTGPEWYKQVLGNLYYRLIGNQTLNGADRLVIHSQHYRQTSPWLANLEIPMDVAPAGVDTVMAQGIRRPGSPYILFAGKPDIKSKGFGVLYQAWRRVRPDFPELGLTVAGGGLQAGRYPGVTFLGQVTSRRKLADLYASAAMTVLPSLSSAESFGMVLAESLVAGTPVIGSDIGGIAELVSPGDNGWLVPPGDVQELALAITAIIHRGAELRAGILARRAVYRQRFDWEQTTERIWQALRACARPFGGRT